MTAQEMINAALRLINVKATGQTISSEEAADALESLNTMLHEWELNGIPIYHEDLVLADDIDVEDNHLKAIKYNLAMELAPEYQAQISAIVVNMALQTYRTLERQYLDVNESEFDYSLVSGRSYNILTD